MRFLPGETALVPLYFRGPRCGPAMATGLFDENSDSSGYWELGKARSYVKRPREILGEFAKPTRNRNEARLECAQACRPPGPRAA